MRKNEKIKCSECNENAVIIENKIYYCGPCYVNEFIRVHKRLRLQPSNHSGKNDDTRI